MRQCTQELKRKFNISNIVMVADNGLNTQGNLLELSKEKNGFLLAHSLAKQKTELVEKLLQGDGWYCVVDKKMKPVDLKLKEIRQQIVDAQGGNPAELSAAEDVAQLSGESHRESGLQRCGHQLIGSTLRCEPIN